MAETYKMLTGDEHLTFNGEELPFTIQRFWQLNLSVLLLNVTRGSFAEYLVLCALSKYMRGAMEQVKSGMEPWDIDGPELVLPGETRPSRIEVKSTASVQIDTPDKNELISLPDQRLRFGIGKTTAENDPEKKRRSDLYVFAHYKAQRKSDNILDLGFWEFYVLPTFRIDEDPVLSKQKTISVWRLKKLKLEPCDFDSLGQAILDAQERISKHFAEQ